MGRHGIYVLKLKMRLLSIWVPVILSMEGYDEYTDLLKVMHFQMGRMRNLRGANLCYLLLDRLVRNEYDLKFWRAHREVWGDPIFELDEEEGAGRIRRSLVMTDADESREKYEFMKGYRHSVYLRDQDLELLLATMKRYMFTWWP